jgi:cell division protein FtsB
MVYKKIKRGNITLTGIIMSLLIIIAIYIGMFSYLQYNANEAGKTIDSKYQSSYDKLQESQAEIDQNNKDIENAFGTVEEADKDFFGLNGLKGLLAVLKMPKIYISTTKETAEALISSTDEGVTPTWLKTLVYIGIATLIILLILAIIKGEQNKI